MVLDSLARRSAAVLRVVTPIEEAVGDGGDAVLRSKLEECARAVDAVLPAELGRLRELAAEADDPVKRAAHEWKIDAVTFQITRAAEIAAARLRHFDALRASGDYEAELSRCSDTLHWFKYYAWGYDPRAALKVVPFVPYEGQQENFILWLDDTVFGRQTSGIVEKSREEGATVGALNWITHKWLFVPGFSALLVSRVEDLVDSKSDPDTLFEKVRFQLRLTPSWMLPEGFDLARDLRGSMGIANPKNGATVGGEAPTVNVGRQRRATVVLADEFQAWPNGGFMQNDALSATSYSVIKLGTPFGTFNQYYQDTHADGANVFVLDWRENPTKDARWYDSLPFGYVAPRMTRQGIAQEVDRSYEASQPGKVFTNWLAREPYVLVTWSELVAYYSQFNLGRQFLSPDTGEYRVPPDWNWGRMQDYGQTDAHKWVITHGARPRETYPLSDSFFVFGYIVAPTGAAVGEVQPLIEAQQNRLGLLGTPELSQTSHEQCGVGGAAETFMEEHGEFWEAWSTDYSVGIPQIQEWLMLVDTTEANPIRPQLVGRTRLYFVCSDEIKLAFNPKTGPRGGYFVTASQSEESFKLARAEMNSYHYPPEELGKAVQLMRPEKKKGMDNFIDTLRAFATRWGPSVAPMTKQERRVAQLPEELRPAHVLSRFGQPDFVELNTAAKHALHQIEKREREAELEFRRRAERLFGGRPVGHRRYRGGRVRPVRVDG